MSDLPDWAKDKALEWLAKHSVPLGEYSYALSHHPWVEVGDEEEDCLAALLVEGHRVAVERAMQARREAALAEVRRVVEDTRERATSSNRVRTCDEILSRLDKL